MNTATQGAQFTKACVSSEKLIGPLGLVAGAEDDKERHPEMAVATRVKSRLDESGWGGGDTADCPEGPWDLQRLP